MTHRRRPGRLAGALYLITHVTSVGAVILYGDLLTADNWLLGEGSGRPQLAGALLDVLLAAAVVGTGVALLPVLRRFSDVAATGYLALRTIEAAVVLSGAAAVMAVVALRRGLDGDELESMAPAGDALVEFYRQAFTVGPGLVVGIHTVLLAALLHRYRLVPRFVTWLGLVGAPLVAASNLTVLFGIQEQTATPVLLAAGPIFAWEISFALVMIIKGLRVEVEPQSPPAVLGLARSAS